MCALKEENQMLVSSSLLYESYRETYVKSGKGSKEVCL